MFIKPCIMACRLIYLTEYLVPFSWINGICLAALFVHHHGGQRGLKSGEPDQPSYETKKTATLKLITFSSNTTTSTSIAIATTSGCRTSILCLYQAWGRSQYRYEPPLAKYSNLELPLTSTLQQVVTSSRIVALERGQEWRFQAPHGAQVTVKLVSGTAEKDGTELAPGTIYVFSGVRTKILTWHRCELEIEGQPDFASTVEFGLNKFANATINLHGHLKQRRENATRLGTEGPRILIAGPLAVGKSTLARTLAAYATKQGYQPLVVNADPEDGILTLPGTLSAAVFATVMDVEAVGDGWGGTPTSGPSSVPVKLPVVHYYGHRKPSEEPEFYKAMVSRLAGTASARMSGVPEVKRSGVIVDSFGIDERKLADITSLGHIIEEMSSKLPLVLPLRTRMSSNHPSKTLTNMRTLSQHCCYYWLTNPGNVDTESIRQREDEPRRGNHHCTDRKVGRRCGPRRGIPTACEGAGYQGLLLW